MELEQHIYLGSHPAPVDPRLKEWLVIARRAYGQLGKVSLTAGRSKKVKKV